MIQAEVGDQLPLWGMEIVGLLKSGCGIVGAWQRVLFVYGGCKHSMTEGVKGKSTCLGLCCICFSYLCRDPKRDIIPHQELKQYQTIAHPAHRASFCKEDAQVMRLNQGVVAWQVHRVLSQGC